MRKTNNPLTILLVGLLIAFLATWILGMLGDIIGLHSMFVVGTAFVAIAGFYVVVVQLLGKSKEESELPRAHPDKFEADDEIQGYLDDRFGSMPLNEKMKYFDRYEKEED